MLAEYKQYIESIRNNLIQNDVDLEYSSLESYQELFMYAFVLEQVIEFYEILGISESEYKLDSKYIHDETREEKITSISNKKYQQILKGYKKLSATYTRLEELRKKVGNLENISKEEKEFIENSVLEVDNMVSLYQSQEGSDVEYASHGIYIDEYIQQENEECERKEDNIYNITETEYSSHGVYIDEVNTNINEESSSDEENSSEEINESYVPHGVYLEDITIIEDTSGELEEDNGLGVIEDASSEDSLEGIKDDGIEYSDSEDDGLIYEEDEEGIVEEEYDDTEDGLVYEDEEEPTWDDEEVYEDDSQYQQNEDDGIEYVDDEDSNTWDGDEVEEEDGIKYSEDDGLIYEDDSEDGLEEPEELEEDQEDVESWLDEDVDVKNKSIASTPDMVEANSVNRQSSSKAVSEEKDISDKLQDVTNKLINQGISMVKGYFK